MVQLQMLAKPTINITTMQKETFFLIRGKASAVKSTVSDNPKAAITGGILLFGFSVFTYSLATGDAEHFNKSINAGLRAVMINSYEIINTGLVPIHFVYESIVESGASIDMIKNDGLAGGLGALGLMIGKVNQNYNEKSTEEKHGIGKGIYVLPVALVALGAVYLFTNDGPFTSHQTTPPSTPIPDNPGPIPTETATHDTYPTDTVVPTENPTEIQPTQSATEMPWYYGKPNYEETTVHTLFGDDIDGVKAPMSQPGNYNVFNTDSPDLLLKHFEIPSLEPHELSPEQYDKLIDEYGSAKVPIVMEQIDTDGNGALDKVAVRYEGSKGTLDFKMDVRKGAGLSGYLDMYLYLNK